MPEDRPHLSFSQISMFAKCPEQWRRRYLEKEIMPPGIALITGGSVHHAAEVNLLNKIVEGTLLPIEAVQEIARDEVHKKFGAQEVDVREFDSKADAIAQSVDETVSLATVHAEIVAPVLEPLVDPDGDNHGIEMGFLLEIPDCDYDLLGYMDVVEQKPDPDREDPEDDAKIIVVRDLKTAAKSPSQRDVDTNMQLSAYSLAATVEFGEDVDDVAIDAVVKTKVPKAVTLTSTRNEGDRGAFVDRVKKVAESIESGAFPPTDPANWWCSERF